MLLTEIIMTVPARQVFFKSLRKSLTTGMKRSIDQAPHFQPCKGCRYFSLSAKRRRAPDSLNEWQTKFESTNPEFDWDFLCDSKNLSFIENNIQNRKGVGDIQKVLYLWDRYNKEIMVANKEVVWKDLIKAAADLPNTHHTSTPIGEESNARLVETVGILKEFEFQPKTVVELGEDLHILRTDNVTAATGHRTYYFMDDLVNLEDALIQFTLEYLQQQGFTLVSVPDLIYSPVIEACGFKTSGERNQVYKIDNTEYNDVCLAGTSEMSLAGYMADECLTSQDLPKKLTAVSRCYRREGSDSYEEKGIYRVHQFTKIEMFGVTENKTGEESDQLLQHFLQIEKYLFTQLGLHFRILEMPTQCLGAPAYRKYDMEAWMPAKQFWGEISSASNCTDYQSRRLGIKYTDKKHKSRHVHTINGTACAVPRMIMAILENYQRKDGSVDIPQVLQPYMDNKTQIHIPRHKHNVHWVNLHKSKTIKS
ncbi:hypothetical protein SNE40_009234 [Patella caerulea]|uniref:serine--tRNA ligase n=1 Tax=Patella caerulea TaxID=87958 RepID=A0AAN8JUQ2_PATCE